MIVVVGSYVEGHSLAYLNIWRVFYSVLGRDCFISYDALHPPEHPVTDVVLRRRVKKRFPLPALGIFEMKLENHENINAASQPPVAIRTTNHVSLE
jgi:hypothetical protein